MYRRILIFGTFDGFHEGHRAYIEEARALGEHIIVVVTPDNVIQQLKQYTPRYDVMSRIEFIKNEYPSIETLVGDADVNSWSVLENTKPDAILLGYDQDILQKSLETASYIQKHHTPIIRARAYKPDIYHNTLLHNQ